MESVSPTPKKQQVKPFDKKAYWNMKRGQKTTKKKKKSKK